MGHNDNLDIGRSSPSYEELEAIAEKLQSGKQVMCSVCREPLELRLPGSGFHPGIFCPNSCTQVLIDVGRQKKADE